MSTTFRVIGDFLKKNIDLSNGYFENKRSFQSPIRILRLLKFFSKFSDFLTNSLKILFITWIPEHLKFCEWRGKGIWTDL